LIYAIPSIRFSLIRVVLPATVRLDDTFFANCLPHRPHDTVAGQVDDLGPGARDDPDLELAAAAEVGLNSGRLLFVGA
jgi:hypothetical protein